MAGPEKYRDVVPATGSADPARTEMTPEEEPNASGTLFLMVIFLMLIFGFWAILYVMLLNR
jgi:hypothetical protein